VSLCFRVSAFYSHFSRSPKGGGGGATSRTL
jgi:hypothetical protein